MYKVEQGSDIKREIGDSKASGRIEGLKGAHLSHTKRTVVRRPTLESPAIATVNF